MVLPEPDRPVTAKNSPERTSSEMPLTAVTSVSPEPKTLVNPTAEIMGVVTAGASSATGLGAGSFWLPGRANLASPWLMVIPFFRFGSHPGGAGRWRV